jgi:hypothetical protein
VTCEEIAELKVSDFVLGMIFEKPFEVFERVYRGYGAEVCHAGNGMATAEAPLLIAWVLLCSVREGAVD